MKCSCLLVSVAVIGLLTAGSARADDREELLKRFDQLKANSMQAIQSGNVQQTETQLQGSATRFNLVPKCNVKPADPVAADQPPVRLGVKIWGQLVDKKGKPGKLVNLMKHRWNPKERFYIWVDAAVPVQMSLFQNYPEGRPASRQVSPDEKMPETFGTIMPGKPYRFPIMIAMDDDMRNELMSIVFVRSDAASLPSNGATATATSQAVSQSLAQVNLEGVPPGSCVIVDVSASSTAVAQGASSTSVATASASGTMRAATIEQQKKTFETIKAAGASAKGTTRFNLVSVPKEKSTASDKVKDVETVVLGPGNMAQIELTLFK